MLCKVALSARRSPRWLTGLPKLGSSKRPKLPLLLPLAIPTCLSKPPPQPSQVQTCSAAFPPFTLPCSGSTATWQMARPSAFTWLRMRRRFGSTPALAGASSVVCVLACVVWVAPQICIYLATDEEAIGSTPALPGACCFACSYVCLCVCIACLPALIDTRVCAPAACMMCCALPPPVA